MRRPESVLVVIYSCDGKVLLLQRREPFPFWQSVTGSLDPGEVPAEAARRELFEETGLVGVGGLVDTGRCREFTIDPRWLDRYPPGVTVNREYEWHCQLDVAVDVRINEREHSAYRWTDVDEAIDLVWSWTNREALLHLDSQLRHGGLQV